MNRLRVKALIGLANIYLSIAFMLLRWARIYVRNTAQKDGIKFSTRQCGKNYRALLILVNHEPRIDSEHDQFVKGGVVTFAKHNGK